MGKDKISEIAKALEKGEFKGLTLTDVSPDSNPIPLDTPVCLELDALLYVFADTIQYGRDQPDEDAMLLSIILTEHIFGKCPPPNNKLN